MIPIIIGLIVVLVIIVVAVNAMQQHKQKLEQEKRAKAAKQKAIIDETEELILQLGNLPSNPSLVSVLNKRCLNAAKAMQSIMPENKAMRTRVQEFSARLKASEDLTDSNANSEDVFMLPDNEQQLVGILQSIKKLRVVIKSEQSKGALDAQSFMAHDQRLEGIQLRISLESLTKRGNQAYSKEMLGSARQYYEKAMQTLNDNSLQTEYTTKMRAMIEEKLEEITNALKSTNAKDAAKKAKAEEDDLDLLFQPKKKW